MNPSVLHLVISLAPGGLERLVVDWTNARNHRHPGSTRIACLDELGAMVGQVENGEVMCVQAKRNRFPWDHAAVRTVVKLLSCRPVVLHAHNLSAWQYAVLSKIQWTINKNSNMDIQDTQDKKAEASFFSSSCKSCLSMLKPPSSTMKERDVSREAPSTSSGQAAKNAKQGVRLIYTQHGANVHNMRLRDRIRARLLACFTDEIVAVSDATADVMAKAMWVSRKRIRVVVNGVAESHGSGVASRKSEVREKMGIPADAFVIGSVGRLAHVKGQDRLIAAFAALKRSQTLCAKKGNTPHLNPLPQGERKDGNQEGEILLPLHLLPLHLLPLPLGERAGVRVGLERAGVRVSSLQRAAVCGLKFDAYLLLTGDGPERANLERQACELGVSGRVIFAGYQADPAPYLAAMDLFVLPSRSEGVSVALLEAMAAGVPVAVTDVGANREVLDDGQCGVILPEDERLWPEAITALITDTDPEATTQRTQAAQQRVHTHYSLDATLDGYERLYGGASGGRIPPDGDTRELKLTIQKRICRTEL